MIYANISRAKTFTRKIRRWRWSCVARRRHRHLEYAIDGVDINFRDRILPFDHAAARAYPAIAAARRALGRLIGQFDRQIAAIARANAAAVATHNTGDSEDCGIAGIDTCQASLF